MGNCQAGGTEDFSFIPSSEHKPRTRSAMPGSSGNMVGRGGRGREGGRKGVKRELPIQRINSAVLGDFVLLGAADPDTSKKPKGNQ